MLQALLHDPLIQTFLGNLVAELYHSSVCKISILHLGFVSKLDMYNKRGSLNGPFPFYRSDFSPGIAHFLSQVDFDPVSIDDGANPYI